MGQKGKPKFLITISIVSDNAYDFLVKHPPSFTKI